MTNRRPLTAPYLPFGIRRFQWLKEFPDMTAVRKDNIVLYKDNRYRVPVGTYHKGIQVYMNLNEETDELSIPVSFKLIAGNIAIPSSFSVLTIYCSFRIRLNISYCRFNSASSSTIIFFASNIRSIA